MRPRNFKCDPRAYRPGLLFVPSVLLFIFGAVVLPLLMFTGPAVCYQIPHSINTTLTGPAPPSLLARIATRSLNLEDKTADFSVTNAHRFCAKNKHKNKNDDTLGQATTGTSTQRIPLDWAGAQTFETMTRVASEPINTVRPKDPLQNSNSQSNVFNSASISTDPPIHSQVDDLKRSAGIFVIIKAIIVSWAVLLVGMLTYVLARFVEEILTHAPTLEAESDEDNEQTVLVGHETV